QSYSGLLQMESTADIGDGWFHGPAVQDRAYLSTGGTVTFGAFENGPLLGRLHVRVEWLVAEEVHSHKKQRNGRLRPHRVEHVVTLRKSADYVEVTTTVHNSVRDHRLRLFCPTRLKVDTFMADTAFDAVERPVQMRGDSYLRREIQYEMTPQQNWVAATDG